MPALKGLLAAGLRSVRRAPDFAALVIGILAVGIGANTAIFSIVYAILLRPLPYADAGQLDLLRLSFGPNERRPSYAGVEIQYIRDRSQVYESLAGTFTVSEALTGDGEPEQVDVGLMTGNFFQTLGVNPVLGRHIAPEEDNDTGPHAVLISFDLWQRRYGGMPDVVGKVILLGGESWTIVGVLPNAFALYGPPDANLGPSTAVWKPLRVDFRTVVHNGHFLRVFARRKPGMTTEAGQAELTRLQASFVEDMPDYAESRMRFHASGLQDEIVRSVRPALVALMAAVGFVLLIACANVANLLLARSVRRQREVAIRSALGASRRDIFALLMAESAVLALSGGILGVGIAWIALEILLAGARHAFPMQDAIRLNFVCLGFAVGLTVLTGILFGLVPALRAESASLASALREGGRAGMSRQGKRLRTALMVGEVAFALVLLVGAGLFIQSFLNISRVRLGFETAGVLTARVALPTTRYDQPGTKRFLDEVIPRLEALPGVVSAGATSHLPLAGRVLSMPYAYDDATAERFGELSVEQHTVTTGYLQTVGTRLLRGRHFEPLDDIEGSDVAIVDNQFAEQVWRGQDPIGQRVMLNRVGGPARWMRVIGVVEHVRHEEVLTVGKHQAYVLPNHTVMNQLTFTVRGGGDPVALATAMRRVIGAVDPDLPVYDPKPLTDYVRDATSTTRLAGTLMGVLAALALALAIVGVYGLMSYTVSERTNEFGIRSALGATPRVIRRLVLDHVLGSTAIGVAIGVAIAMGMARLGSALFYGISASDGKTMGVAALAILIATLLAAWLPASRAARTDTLAALRSE
ncbi:MAG: ABC transporter permease [Gemmatimonadaceae bacterium]|nr:ABC transporter permease [Gemmatimonadaceae bacterium]